MSITSWITTLAPSIVAVFYAATSIAYFVKKDVAWGIVWAGYAFANIGLIWAGNR